MSRSELRGIASIFVLGSALHFSFEWSGRVIPIAQIGMAVLGILFVLFVFHTPHLSVFTDPVTVGPAIVEQC